MLISLKVKSAFWSGYLCSDRGETHALPDTLELPYDSLLTAKEFPVLIPRLRTICIAMLLGLTVALAAQGETLVVYGDDTYQPVISSQSGKPVGVLVDILRKVSEQSGDSYDIQLFPWKRAYELASMGKGALIGVSKTTERQQIFDFSEPLYNDDIQIVVLKGREFPFTQLADLKGKSLGGVLGASYGEAVDKAIQENLFKVDRDIGQSGRLKKLLAHRMDGALIGNGQAGFESVLASDPLLLAQRHQFLVLKTPLTRDPLYLAAARSMDKKAVIERFNKALRELQKNGILKRVAPVADNRK
jgi:ABC-type amino acid transport substrate-binding protein